MWILTGKQNKKIEQDLDDIRSDAALGNDYANAKQNTTKQMTVNTKNQTTDVNSS